MLHPPTVAHLSVTPEALENLTGVLQAQDPAGTITVYPSGAASTALWTSPRAQDAAVMVLMGCAGVVAEALADAALVFPAAS
jgi:hypothetical protein